MIATRVAMLLTQIILRRKKINSPCELLISKMMVGRAGVEPTTNGLKEVSSPKNLYKSMT
jgi:hypothetical protein